MALPDQFEGVTAVCKANVYFEGKVVSHTILFQDGSRKTLGLIFPGAYNFGTAAPERMEVTAGQCRVKLAGTDAWKTYATGQAFDVPGNSAFDISVDGDIMQYICSYLA